MNQDRKERSLATILHDDACLSSHGTGFYQVFMIYLRIKNPMQVLYQEKLDLEELDHHNILQQ